MEIIHFLSRIVIIIYLYKIIRPYYIKIYLWFYGDKIDNSKFKKHFKKMRKKNRFNPTK